MIAQLLRLAIVAVLLVIVPACVDGRRLSGFLNAERIDASGGPPGALLLRTSDGKGIPPDLLTGYTFSDALKASAAAPNDANVAKEYLRLGIALSDELCADWFEKLGRAQAIMDADKDSISNAGSLAATILALTGAHSATVGGVAGGFGLLGAQYKSEEADFIVAPDVAAVKDTIDTIRASAAQSLLTTPPATFGETRTC